MFCPFLIFPLIYFVPDEHHEREAAARRTRKSFHSKSSINDRRRSDTGEEVELQKVETVNGNPKTNTDEEATAGGDGEDLVDYIPGKRAFDRNSYSPVFTDRHRLLVMSLGILFCIKTVFTSCVSEKILSTRRW